MMLHCYSYYVYLCYIAIHIMCIYVISYIGLDHIQVMQRPCTFIEFTHLSVYEYATNTMYTYTDIHLNTYIMVIAKAWDNKNMNM